MSKYRIISVINKILMTGPRPNGMNQDAPGQPGDDDDLPPYARIDLPDHFEGRISPVALDDTEKRVSRIEDN